MSLEPWETDAVLFSLARLEQVAYITQPEALDRAVCLFGHFGPPEALR